MILNLRYYFSKLSVKGKMTKDSVTVSLISARFTVFYCYYVRKSSTKRKKNASQQTNGNTKEKYNPRIRLEMIWFQQEVECLPIKQ